MISECAPKWRRQQRAAESENHTRCRMPVSEVFTDGTWERRASVECVSASLIKLCEETPTKLDNVFSGSLAKKACMIEAFWSKCDGAMRRSRGSEKTRLIETFLSFVGH